MELQKLIDGLKAHRSGAASYESVDEAIRIFEAMRDVDGEKVVNGLEFCIRNQWGVCAKECPYKMLCFYTEGEKVMKRLVSDALALIRQQQERIVELEAAQTARVMTLEELENALDTVVWVEEPKFRNGASGRSGPRTNRERL